MRNSWHKIRKMSLSEPAMKSSPSSTTKRFHLNMFINHVYKFFASSNHPQQEDQQSPQNPPKLPSISITSPEGYTTVVE